MVNWYACSSWAKISHRLNFFSLKPNVRWSIWVPVFPLGSRGSKGWKGLWGDSEGGQRSGDSPQQTALGTWPHASLTHSGPGVLGTCSHRHSVLRCSTCPISVFLLSLAPTALLFRLCICYCWFVCLVGWLVLMLLLLFPSSIYV